jgi:type II secretory pathway component PulF
MSVQLKPDISPPTDRTPVEDQAEVTTESSQAPAQSQTGSPIEQETKENQSVPPPAKKVKKPKKQKVFGGIDKDTSEYFLDSMSMLLQADVSVGEALESIVGEISNKKVKEEILTMRSSIDEGTPFSKAIEETGLFSASVVTLIEIGESTGRLPQNLKVVAEQMHKNNQMTARIKSAMLYPAFLVTLLFVVGTGIGVFLLPKLLTVIEALHEKVGPITQALIIVGNYFGHYGLIFAGAVVLGATALFIGVRLNDHIREAAEAVIFRVPGIKKLLFETELARFGFILGTLLQAGLPVVTALNSLASSMATRRYRHFAEELRTRIDEGDSFSKILAQPEYRKMLSGTTCQIIISAEKSGNLAPSLLKIGDNYQDKADITARNLETLLEPIVLVLIAGAVLFVALAVFLPIYSLIGQFNTNQG